MANFSLTNLALNMYCPGNVAQLDDAGLPSIMVWIPAFRLCDVLNTTDESIHPAFIVNGVQIPGFWYSKYQNVVHNGKAYSLPGEAPGIYSDFDKSLNYCDSKGYGWHMGTNAEWAAIALWCKKNEFLPYGNNNNGRDTRESAYKAVAAAHTSDGLIMQTCVGTGPLTWSHDKTMSGIWDMNGNVWERQGGIRTVWGELQVLANNDAADLDNPQNSTSVCWKAIDAADGSFVDPECKVTDTDAKATGRTVKLDFQGDVWAFSTGITNKLDTYKGCLFGSAICADAISDNAKMLLRALALLPDADATSSQYEEDYMYWDNTKPECVIVRGGGYNTIHPAGIFSLDARYERSRTAANTGFRASYIPNI